MSKKLELKSRNTLYRLFKGYYSYEMSKELTDRITKCVDFSENELLRLDELLHKQRKKRFTVRSNEILSYIYSNCKDSFETEGKKSLSSALNKCSSMSSGGDKAVLIISGITDQRIIFDIYRFLKKNIGCVKVYNYLRFSVRDRLAAYEALALIRLSEFEDYIPLKAAFGDRYMTPGIQILRKNAEGCYMYKAEFSGGRVMLLETPVTDDMYEYEIEKNRGMAERAEKLKFTVKRVADYIKILNDIKELDLNSSFFSEGAPCFGYLTSDILVEMFKEINYFGFPQQHPYVQSLIKLVRDKDEAYRGEGARKRMLFDIDVLEQMMKTGYSVDHAAEFPPMSLEQRKRYFEGIIMQAKTEPEKYSFRILKNLSVGCSYVYVEGHMLYIYRSKTGYTDGSAVIVREKCVNEIMREFTDYIWESCTLSDCESIAETEKLMKKYLYQ